MRPRFPVGTLTPCIRDAGIVMVCFMTTVLRVPAVVDWSLRLRVAVATVFVAGSSLLLLGEVLAPPSTDYVASMAATPDRFGWSVAVSLLAVPCLVGTAGRGPCWDWTGSLIGGLAGPRRWWTGSLRGCWPTTLMVPPSPRRPGWRGGCGCPPS